MLAWLRDRRIKSTRPRSAQRCSASGAMGCCLPSSYPQAGFGLDRCLYCADHRVRWQTATSAGYQERPCVANDWPGSTQARHTGQKFGAASAHNLAPLVYFMLTKGQAEVEAGQDEYGQPYRQRVVQNLTRRTQQLGFQLAPQGASSA